MNRTEMTVEIKPKTSAARRRRMYDWLLEDDPEEKPAVDAAGSAPKTSTCKRDNDAIEGKSNPPYASSFILASSDEAYP